MLTADGFSACNSKWLVKMELQLDSVFLPQELRSLRAIFFPCWLGWPLKGWVGQDLELNGFPTCEFLILTMRLWTSLQQVLLSILIYRSHLLCSYLTVVGRLPCLDLLVVMSGVECEPLLWETKLSVLTFREEP